MDGLEGGVTRPKYLAASIQGCRIVYGWDETVPNTSAPHKPGNTKETLEGNLPTEHSWMSGRHVRVGDDVISRRVAGIETALLEAATGTYLLQATLSTRTIAVAHFRPCT